MPRKRKGGTKINPTLSVSDFVADLNRMGKTGHKYLDRDKLASYFHLGLFGRSSKGGVYSSYFSTVISGSCEGLNAYWVENIGEARVCQLCGHIKLSSRNLTVHIEDAHPFLATKTLSQDIPRKTRQMSLQQVSISSICRNHLCYFSCL